MSLKVTAILALITTILGILGAIIFYGWMMSSMNRANEHPHSDEYIRIERGSTPSQIISKLASEGVLKNELPALIYLRIFSRSEKLRAGDYRFKSPITPLEVLKELEKGTIETKKLVIPEGFTRFDIAKRIVDNFPQDPPQTEDQILLLMNETDKIRDFAPEARNLEGYMFPSTYEFPPKTPPEQIISVLTDQFRKIWKPEWSDLARQMGRTPHEIVTIASLIETESSLESERPIVASVIYNRLDKNIPLGIDQTVVYVAKLQRRWDGTINKSDIEALSPYNTRKYAGLPPGPISSVSVSSIEAALNPARTDYLYYVRNVQVNDGSHHFYSSAAEFEKGKAEYQRWLENERRRQKQEEAEKIRQIDPINSQ